MKLRMILDLQVIANVLMIWKVGKVFEKKKDISFKEESFSNLMVFHGIL